MNRSRVVLAALVTISFAVSAIAFHASKPSAKSVGSVVPTGQMLERFFPGRDDVTAALGTLPSGTFVIVEQDMYPCDFDRPYPIAARTRKALQTAGIG